MFLQETREDKPNTDSADKFDLASSLCQSLVQGCKSTGLQVYKSTGLQVYRSTVLHVYKFTSLQVYRLFFCFTFVTECLNLNIVNFLIILRQLWFTSSGSLPVVYFKWITYCSSLRVVYFLWFTSCGQPQLSLES